MKDWPEGDKPADFESLTEPLCKALRFAYRLHRQNADKDVPWKGPGIGERQLACCPDAREQLRAENLAYALEDQGRDALTEIVGLALRLGIEQGRRIAISGPEIQTLKLQARLGELLSDRTDRAA